MAGQQKNPQFLITLNPNDPYEAQVLSYLFSLGKRSGQPKKMLLEAFESRKAMGLVSGFAPTQPQPRPQPQPQTAQYTPQVSFAPQPQEMPVMTSNDLPDFD